VSVSMDCPIFLVPPIISGTGKATDYIFTARNVRSVARYCRGKLSVRLSVTLVDCDQTRSNSLKIISRLTSLTFLLFADSNTTDLLQSEHPKF